MPAPSKPIRPDLLQFPRLLLELRLGPLSLLLQLLSLPSELVLVLLALLCELLGMLLAQLLHGVPDVDSLLHAFLELPLHLLAFFGLCGVAGRRMRNRRGEGCRHGALAVVVFCPVRVHCKPLVPGTCAVVDDLRWFSHVRELEMLWPGGANLTCAGG